MSNVFGIFLFLQIILWNGVNGTGIFELSSIEEKLQILNKPAVKTIKTLDGDIFDCVDINNQPAFHHPLLKNHKLQMKPNVARLNQISSEESKSNASAGIGLKDGGCPVGTVPIRRTSKEEILTAEDSFKNHTRSLMNSPHGTDNRDHTTHLLLMGVHKDQFYGTSAYLNIWPLKLELKPNTLSSVGLYVQNLPSNVIHAGWMVNPGAFKDSKSRLYASWNNNYNGKQLGCFNMFCPGFVQIHTSIPLGLAFDQMSSYDGPQYEVHVQISKEESNGGNWWLYVNGAAVGYWPRQIISDLSQSATQVVWGGSNLAPNAAGFLPPMGSGNPPEFSYRRACYIRTIMLKNSKQVMYDPDKKFIRVQPRPSCYRIVDPGYMKGEWRRHLYLGGGQCKI